MKNSKKNLFFKNVVIFVITICMLFSAAIPALATDEEVRSVADGVLYLERRLDGDGKSYKRSSCFLINEDTIITANHCVQLTKEEYQYIMDVHHMKKEDVDKHLSYTVTIQSDFTIPAKVINSSENMDFAILKLSQPISNHTFLKLRDSKTVQAAETAYSVGFPYVKDTTGDFNKKDITFESGTINRTQFKDDEEFESRTDVARDSNDNPYITYYHFRGEALLLSGKTFTGGSSGGPLVDSNGNVIGICVAGDDNYNCVASAIDQVMEVLDTINVKYTKADASNIETTDTENTESDDTVAVDYSALQTSINKAEGIKKDDYTAESYEKLSSELAAAKTALSAKTQAEVDTAKQNLDKAIDNLEAKPSVNYALIIAIAAIALVIVAIIIIIIAKKGKKDKTVEVATPVQSVPQPEPVAVGAGVAAPVAQSLPSGSNETTVLSADGSETTVLSADGGETTVLSQNVNGGTLIRSSNNENIPITYSGFRIGRQRQEVDYCVSDNTNVGRNHAKFIVRDGVTYIVDNKSTNGTFVNNTSVRPGHEVQLMDGDTIMLADEKFTFKK